MNNIEKIKKEFNEIDRVCLVVIKGHLLIEESLSFTIENFVHHGEIMEKVKPTFFQKIFLAKSMTLSSFDHKIWDILVILNELRNDFAHRLQSKKRKTKIEKIKNLYISQVKNLNQIHDWKEEDPAGSLAAVFALCLGFLGQLEEETKRFRNLVKEMDKIVN